jgi:hypothetical protein
MTRPRPPHVPSSSPRRRPAWWVAAVAGASLAFVQAAEKPAKPAPLPEVLVVGDAGLGVTPEMARPMPGKPITYLIVGGVEKNLGDAVVNLKLPDAATVRGEVTKALASQGYVEAREGGPKPQIAILFSWGTANLVTLDADELTPPPPPGVSPGNPQEALGVLQFNRREINQLIGADKADRHWLGALEGDQLNEAYRNDRIYVTVAALDVAAAARKERRLLWRTRISLDWRDHAAGSFSVMLASAAPFFGLNTARGVFVDDALRRKAEVEIGPTRVIEEPREKSPPPEKAKR